MGVVRWTILIGIDFICITGKERLKLEDEITHTYTHILYIYIFEDKIARNDMNTSEEQFAIYRGGEFSRIICRRNTTIL